LRYAEEYIDPRQIDEIDLGSLLTKAGLKA